MEQRPSTAGEFQPAFNRRAEIDIPADRPSHRRLFLFAPTSVSGFLLAACMFLPFGTYQGCGATAPTVETPYEQQWEALKTGDYGGLLFLSSPHLAGAAIAIGAIAAWRMGAERGSRMLWGMYSLAIVLTCVGLSAALLLKELSRTDVSLVDRWREHGDIVLTLFWLLNVVLATFLEARTMFQAAMLLQLFLAISTWLILPLRLLFLKQLLIGGGLQICCSVVLPLATALQVYGDPAMSRESLRKMSGVAAPQSGNGTPQFSIGAILIATTLCAALLGIGQVVGGREAMFSGYAATFVLLAWRRLRRSAGSKAERRRSLITACWYATVTAAIAIGGWLAS